MMKPLIAILNFFLLLIAWFFMMADSDMNDGGMVFKLVNREGEISGKLYDDDCLLSLYTTEAVHEISISRKKGGKVYVHLECLNENEDCLSAWADSCLNDDCKNFHDDDTIYADEYEYEDEATLRELGYYYSALNLMGGTVCEDIENTNCLALCDKYGESQGSISRLSSYLNDYDRSDTLGPFCWGKDWETNRPVASISYVGGGCLNLEPCDPIYVTVKTASGTVSTLTFKYTWDDNKSYD